MPLTARIRVRTYELDSFGHVNNAVYLQYFEQARDEYLRLMGLSFDDFARTQTQFVITEARVRYASPARYGDELLITGEIAELGPASALFTYKITRGEVLIAEGETRGAFLNPSTGRPIRIPEPFKSAFVAQNKTDRE
jgi:YbgC/YbaW family acyl-CoA thioester hydrolase